MCVHAPAAAAAHHLAIMISSDACDTTNTRPIDRRHRQYFSSPCEWCANVGLPQPPSSTTATVAPLMEYRIECAPLREALRMAETRARNAADVLLAARTVGDCSPVYARDVHEARDALEDARRAMTDWHELEARVYALRHEQARCVRCMA